MGSSFESVYPELDRRWHSAQADPRLQRTRGGIYATSTCRSKSEQARLRNLYVRWPTRYPVAAPVGTSPHQIGAIWGDEFCHAVDTGFRHGNPPYGNIRTRPKRVPRHPDWILLEQVMNDHGLARTVPSEEWHYQLAGSKPLLIVPTPTPGDRLMSVEQEIHDLHKSLDQIRQIASDVSATRAGLLTVAGEINEVQQYMRVFQADMGNRMARLMRALKTGDDAEFDAVLREIDELQQALLAQDDPNAEVR